MLTKVRQLISHALTQTDPDTGTQDRERVLRLATTALMLEIARADATVSEVEESVIAELVRHVYGLSAAETRALTAAADARADASVSLYDFTRDLNDHLSREERVRVVELLWEVAHADRRIDKYEEYFVRKIADLLYVSHSDFIRTKLRVTGG